MNIISNTNIGTRKENQDRVKTVLLSDGSALAILCDGMGGENAGGTASEIAINMMYDRITSSYKNDFDTNSIRNLILSAVSASNAAVYSAAVDDESKEGMGTTCVVVLVRDNLIHIANVGDSRAYCITDNELQQLTVDHTVVRFLYEQGKISEEDMINHPQRNLITRAVGASSTVDVDYFEVARKSGNAILLCSDGLSSFCSAEEIFGNIDVGNIEVSAEKLINKAITNGSSDNISLALISDL